MTMVSGVEESAGLKAMSLVVFVVSSARSAGQIISVHSYGDHASAVFALVHQ